jgi:hypothetical protein
LLHAEAARNVFQYRDTRHPKVAGKELSDETRSSRFG